LGVPGVIVKPSEKSLEDPVPETIIIEKKRRHDVSRERVVGVKIAPSAAGDVQP
jgi:hypothetical protein